jgi:hypothetical protein
MKEIVMLKWKTAVVAMFCLVGFASTDAIGAGQKQGQMRDQAQKRDHIYGHELMTSEERSIYRKELHSIKTEQEREVYLMEHQKKIQKLAKAKGMPLSDNQHSPVEGMGGSKEGSGR